MIDPHVVEVGDVERVIGAIAVGVDDAVGLDFTGDYGDQRIGLGVFHGDREHMTAALQEAEDGDFSRRAASAFALPHAAEITLIDLDFASQFGGFFDEFVSDDNAQAMIKIRRCD